MSPELFPKDAPLLSRDIRSADVTDTVLAPMGRWPGVSWYILFGIAKALVLLLFTVVGLQFVIGLGIFAITNPVGWGVYIVNFVFWVGIGHAGTLISAILFIFRQKWRTAINRSAEAMTIFAVMTAGIFPLIHVGRSWVAYWLIPYPAERLLWPNFRSPLLWDVFAVTTYLTVSLLFWYQGLIPDWATARDRAKNKIFKTIYSFLSFGWTGSVRDWNHYERGYAQFAWISAPLVLSVHSIVSFDFAVSLIPGWHTTFFPPYFVAGAVFSGFAMVVTLLVIMRKVFQMEHLITIRHLEYMNKIILTTSMLVSYAYITEFVIAWYSGHQSEQYAFYNRAFGPYGWAFWVMFICNAVIPHAFWWKSIRTSLGAMFVISIFVNIGMWFERFNIVMSLHRDFLPASWGTYTMTPYDYAITAGGFGLFFTLFLLFCRTFPTIAIGEMKTTLPNPSGTHGHGHGHGSHDSKGHHAPATTHATPAETGAH